MRIADRGQLRAQKSTGRLARRLERRRFASIRRKKKKTQFRTRDGLLLLFSLGAFFALIFTLVYLFWLLPLERAIEYSQ